MARIDRDSVAIGSAIRGAIAQAGLSQAEVAERTPMSLQTLSRRINGLLPFTWPEVVMICDLVDVPPHEIAAAAVRIAAKTDPSMKNESAA